MVARRRGKVGLWRLCLYAVLVLVVTATSAHAGALDQPEEAPPFRELIVVVPEDIVSLDPARYQRHALTESLHRLLYRRLFSRDGDAFSADLASSIEALDERTWRVKVAPGDEEAAGDSLTPGEIASAFRRLISPTGIDGFPSAARTRLAAIESVSVEGDAVVFKLNRPWPGLPAQLEREVVPRVGAGGEVAATSAFRVERWDRGRQLLLSRVDEAGEGEPTHIRIEVVASAEERLNRVLAGTAHIGVALPGDAYWRLRTSSRAKPVTAAQSRVHFVEFDVTRPPFDDQRVRKALNMAIDMQRVIDLTMQEQAVPVATILSPATYGFDPGVEPIAYDPAGARELLAQAGYPLGFDFELDAPIGKRRVAEAVSRMLADVGVKAFVRVWSDWSSLREQIRLGNRQAWLGEWGNSSMDPASAIRSKLHSAGEANYGGYRDRRLDAMLDRADALLSPGQRLAAYREIQRYLKEEAAMLFGYTIFDVYGADVALEWQPAPEGLLGLESARWRM